MSKSQDDATTSVNIVLENAERLHKEWHNPPTCNGPDLYRDAMKSLIRSVESIRKDLYVIEAELKNQLYNNCRE